MLVKKSRLEQLQYENKALNESLYQWQEMRPFLDLAKDVKARILTELEDIEGRDSAEIGEVAFRSVLESEMERARGDVVKKYERAHRQALYERVVDEVEAVDGENIMAEVQTRLETDPDLLLELRSSARKELAAGYHEGVVQVLSAEQEKIVQAEAERQIELDRIDVAFALDKKINLSETVEPHLKPHDTMSVYFNTIGEGKKLPTPIIFEWRVDVNGKAGWVFTEEKNSLQGDFDDIPKDKFTDIGTMQPDLEKGEHNYVEDVLTVDTMLCLEWQHTPKTKRYHVIRKTETTRHARHGFDYISSNHYEKKTPLSIRAIDLQTRPVEFA